MEVLPGGGASTVARGRGHLRLSRKRSSEAGRQTGRASESKGVQIGPSRPVLARFSARIDRHGGLVRALPPGMGLVPGAETRPAGAREAQTAVWTGAHGEGTRARKRDPGGQLLLERGAVGLRVANAHKLLRALEEPVHDLDARRALAQSGERIDKPVDAVIALDQLAQPRLGPNAVALVVQYEVPAAGLAREQVDHAGDQRLLR